MPVGRTPYTFRPWAHRDREQLFTDILEENRIHTRYDMGYEDYADKSYRRYYPLDFYAQKYMIHDRFTKHRPSIWTGYLA